MAECTAGYEQGTSGNTIKTTDTGDATAWNTVSIPTGGTAIYDNTHAGVTGSPNLAGKYATGTTSGQCMSSWTTAFGTVSGTHFGRAYLYLTANPGTSQVGFVRYITSPGTIEANFYISTTGVVSAKPNTGTVLSTTNTISLNQWIRVEWMIVQSATVGQLEIKLFNNPDSTTATETATSAANLNTGASSNNVNVGITSTIASFGPFWIDGVDVGAASYPGPFASSAESAPPLVQTYAVERASFW